MREGQIFARLRSCARLNGTPQYMALSHCWGTLPTLRLTDETYDELCQGCDIGSLPKTFREAIEITTRLGHRYLWIDSPCIFQDSPEDWVRQSATMADVYRNSACTITALRAENSHDSCFSKRTVLQVISHAGFPYATKTKFTFTDLTSKKNWRRGKACFLRCIRSVFSAERGYVQERLL